MAKNSKISLVRNSSIPLVSELTEPPAVGRTYRVNCVNFYHHPMKRLMWLPALGAVHADPEVGGIGCHPHVHYDFRFVNAKMMYEVFDISAHEWKKQMEKGTHWRVMATVRGKELPAVRYEQPPSVNGGAISQFEFRLVKMRCIREQMTMPERNHVGAGITWWNPLAFRLESVCAGKRIDPESIARGNPVCPHRGISLADVPVDSDGCVTCPGHGLRWNMATGEMVTRFAELPDNKREELVKYWPSPSKCLEGGTYGTK